MNQVINGEKRLAGNLDAGQNQLLLRPDSGNALCATVKNEAGGYISAAALYRDRSQIYPLHGLKCKSCNNIHFPPQRVCPKCKAKDQFDEWRLSDRKATLFTFAADYLCQRREAPRVTAIVDFEGGGRMATIMTDRVLDEIKIGMPIEMSFRKLATQDGFHNYFWKSIPVRG